jgi:chromosome segregation ATPase
LDQTREELEHLRKNGTQPIEPKDEFKKPRVATLGSSSKLSSELQALQESYNNLKTSHDLFADEKHSLEQRLNSLELEHAALKDQFNESCDDRESIQSRLHDAQRKLQLSTKDCEDLSLSVQSLTNQRTELLHQCNAMQRKHELDMLEINNKIQMELNETRYCTLTTQNTELEKQAMIMRKFMESENASCSNTNARIAQQLATLTQKFSAVNEVLQTSLQQAKVSIKEYAETCKTLSGRLERATNENAQLKSSVYELEKENKLLSRKVSSLESDGENRNQDVSSLLSEVREQREILIEYENELIPDMEDAIVHLQIRDFASTIMFNVIRDVELNNVVIEGSKLEELENRCIELEEEAETYFIELEEKQECLSRLQDSYSRIEQNHEELKEFAKQEKLIFDETMQQMSSTVSVHQTQLSNLENEMGTRQQSIEQLMLANQQLQQEKLRESESQLLQIQRLTEERSTLEENVAQLQQSLRSHQEEIAKLNSELDESETEANEMESELHQLVQKYKDTSKDLTDCEQELTELHQALQEKEQHIQSCQQEISRLALLDQKNSSHISQLEQDIASAANQLQSAQQRIQTVEQERDQLATNISLQQQELNSRNMIIEQYQNEFVVLKKNIEGREQDRQAIQRTLQTREAELLEAQIAEQQLQGKVTNQAGKLVSLEQNLLSLQATLKSNSQDLQSTQTALSVAQENLLKTRVHLRESQQELQKTRAHEKKLQERFRQETESWTTTQDQLQQQIIDQNLEIITLQNQNKHLQFQMDSIIEKSMRSSVLTNTDTNELLRKEVANLQIQVAETKSFLKRVTGEKERLAKALDVAQTHYRTKMDTLRQNQKDAEAEVSFLENWLDQIKQAFGKHAADVQQYAALRKIHEEFLAVDANNELV